MSNTSPAPPASQGILVRLLSATDLPFAAAASQLTKSLSPGAALAVTASAGSGKTTLLPAALADNCAGRVLVTQPRRVAARAGARRIASLLGEELGPTVAYSVRGESTLRESTRIEFVTPGILVRRLQADPELPGVGAIIFDEFHERHLDTDLATAFALEVRQTLREDLILAITSATVNMAAVEQLFTDAGLESTQVSVDCPIFPLHERYRPAPAGVDALYVNPGGGLSVSQSFIEHTVRTAAAEMTGTAGDCLVFLPGVAEIQRALSCAAVLPELDSVEVLALHGGLSASQQDRVFRPGGRRRMIFSTAIAESSVTVPGVRVVVDAGLSREPRVDSATGIGGLTTVWASRASAVQRAGRAARQGPGVVVRIGSESEWAMRPAFAQPEFLVGDLTWACLQAAVWGAPGFAGLALCDVPSPGAVEGVAARLRSLELVGHDGVPTELGRRVASFPLPPAVGRAAVVGAELLGARRAAELVAFVSADLRPQGADLAHIFGAVCRRSDPQWRSARDAIEVDAQRIFRLLTLTGEDASGSAGRVVSGGLSVGRDALSGDVGDEDALAQIAAAAFPMWVARARSDGSRAYATVQGVGAELPVGSPLIGSSWLVITQMTRQPGQSTATIRSAIPVSAQMALDSAKNSRHFRTEAQVVHGRVRLVEHEHLGALVLRSRPGGVLSADEACDVLLPVLAQTGWSLFEWSEAARGLRDRLAALHECVGPPWPDVSDEALLARVRTWLGPEIAALADGAPVKSVDMLAALQRLLPWPEASRLEELAPARMPVPVGGTRPVDWSSGRPVVALRVQEAFGWVQTPTWADGRGTCVIHLLDPAGRPVAVTSDLASFWGEPYRQVRAQLRGRYPKHPWPEDPLSDEPTSWAKPRRR